MPPKGVSHSPFTTRLIPSFDLAVTSGRCIEGDGSLTKIGELGGLPDTIDGDVPPSEYGPGGSPAGIDVI